MKSTNWRWDGRDRPESPDRVLSSRAGLLLTVGLSLVVWASIWLIAWRLSMIQWSTMFFPS